MDWDTIFKNLKDNLQTGRVQAKPLSEEEKAAIKRKDHELTQKLRANQGLKEEDLRWKSIPMKK